VVQAKVWSSSVPLDMGEAAWLCLVAPVESWNVSNCVWITWSNELIGP